MMKSPDEIKLLMANHKSYTYSLDELMRDALALIQQLQKENAEKDARIQQLEAERDELMVFVKGQCSACKFSDYSYTEDPCDSCFADRRSKWQWRGVQKEE